MGRIRYIKTANRLMRVALFETNRNIRLTIHKANVPYGAILTP